MDFSDLYGELNRRLHGETTNATFLAALKVWINLARKQIVAFNPDWYFLQAKTTEALIADQISYSLASDVVKINPEEVRLTTTKTRLVHAETKDFELISDPTVSATPTHFRLVGYQSMDLYPPPNSAAVTAETSVTYEYTKTFTTDMSGDADTHDLPIHFEPVLLDIAESLGWMYLRRFQQASFVWQRAIATLQSHHPDGNEFVKRMALTVAPPMVSDKPELIREGGS
jgi:hypothetical protein